METAISIEKKPGLFDDLESDFDGGSTIPVTPSGFERAAKTPASFAMEVTLGAGKTVAKLARFPCGKCGGSGLYDRGRVTRLGHADCNRCHGSGLQKTDPKAAAERRAKKEAKRAAEHEARLTAWIAAHPEENAWLLANMGRFDFAASLTGALGRYGSLTEGQLLAVHKCIERDATYAERKAQAAAERAAAAPNVAGAGFSKMVDAFAKAIASGLKRPKLTVGDYQFSPAKATSNNPGCIYVTRLGAYLGKITAEGKFLASRECTSERVTEIEKIALDPLAAAVMHGKKTGNCSCCGRHLENEESVELGIGPICRSKWGL